MVRSVQRGQPCEPVRAVPQRRVVEGEGPAVFVVFEDPWTHIPSQEVFSFVHDLSTVFYLTSLSREPSHQGLQADGGGNRANRIRGLPGNPCS